MIETSENDNGNSENDNVLPPLEKRLAMPLQIYAIPEWAFIPHRSGEVSELLIENENVLAYMYMLNKWTDRVLDMVILR